MLYRIGRKWSPPVTAVDEALGHARFVECRPTQEKSVGWMPPRGEEHGALVESVGGQWIAKFGIETKLLPASVVRREAERRMEEIEAKTGRKPGKKEARDIRESVAIQLMPQAFTRLSTVQVWIDPKARLLAIDTVSQAKADEVLTNLIRGLEGFTVTALDTRIPSYAAMATWLGEQDPPPGFGFDRECELKSTDDTQSAVRYSRHALDIVEIRRHVEAGKLPTRLALLWNAKVSFVLTDKLAIKKIRFVDGVFKEAGVEGEEDRFDTDMTIATGELKSLIADLVSALGGESEPEGQ